MALACRLAQAKPPRGDILRELSKFGLLNGLLVQESVVRLLGAVPKCRDLHGTIPAKNRGENSSHNASFALVI